MNDVEIDALLDLAKSTVLGAAQQVRTFGSAESRHHYSQENPKELKAVADTVLEKFIVDELSVTDIPILSEESGELGREFTNGYRFIVDPLDGTYNFVKDFSDSAVSIGLWHDNTPIFGVIYSISKQELYWGGRGIGAFSTSGAITVSSVSEKQSASICTGFPVRQDLGAVESMTDFWSLVTPFSKVRMLGSAAISLINVAKGSTEVYAENNIMLWDVAAGVSIVEGAGGAIELSTGTEKNALNVCATNNCLCI